MSHNRTQYCYEVVHQGHQPMHIRILAFSLRPLRVEHFRFRFCTHPEHSRAMAALGDSPELGPPKGWAIVIIRVGRRRRVINTPYLNINRQIRRRVAKAMRRTAILAQQKE